MSKTTLQITDKALRGFRLFYLFRIAGLILTILLSSSSFSRAETVNPADIPPELSEWKSWVLHGKPEHVCPWDYNNGEMYRCTWPSRLKVFIEPSGGRFEQELLLFADAWIPLPGDTDRWPREVKLNHGEIPVISRDGVPSVYVNSGEHRIEGIFEWTEMPETLRIPPGLGLVSLFIDGQAAEFPLLDKNSRLWLQKRESSEAREEDRLGVVIYRLLDDAIPMTVTNLIQLNISGRAREIRLENILLQNAVPMNLESRLPARIGPKNEIMFQARPGRWEIRILSRFESPVHEIGPVKGAYGQEIWSFKPEHHLRMVKVEGIASVEPTQTDIPADWKSFPAYIIDPDAKITFKEIRRGDPDPAPDRLSLNRIWWLDFDGTGFTVQDTITGAMSRQWYLAMNPPGVPGRISVDGTDQLITLQSSGKPGVELRRGELNLVAESRYDSSARVIPAVGWDHDFQSVSGEIRLPPGWRLLTAGGADVLPGTCFQRWTLLDFFMVLIIAASVWKLRTLGCGILALAAMTLIYHEPESPRILWLHILAALGLLKVLPQGKIKKFVIFWGAASLAVLTVIVIPFMVQQVRIGIYPQLEYDRGIETDVSSMTLGAGSGVRRAEDQISMSYKEKSSYEMPSPSQMLQNQNIYLRKQAVFTQDPNALIQTGPGLPAWNWRSVRMNWNGPVSRDQQLRLWLISPRVNFVLAFLRVLLLAGLIIALVHPKYWRSVFNGDSPSGGDTPPPFPCINTAIMYFFAALWLMSPIAADCGEKNAEISESETVQSSGASCYPPSELLQELEKRLSEKPDCLPFCADCNRMELTVTDESIQVMMEIHAACETAVPLPGNSESWIPQEVFLNQQPVRALSRDTDGLLRALIPQGIHKLTLTGRTGTGNTIQIPLPLKPHQAAFTSQGWDVQGILPGGRIEASIQLTRLKKNDSDLMSGQGSAVPPFLHIERVLHLGLTWEVSTTITRLTPPGTPVVISVPLLKDESVTTAEIHTEKGAALINMNAAATEIQWSSSLKMSPEIQLRSPGSVTWTETWIVDASPIWHCDFSGIAVIHHQDEAGHWRPTWKPWPGESVTIKISRPEAIPGQMLTIDSAALGWTPGERVNKASLTLRIRTSRGGQHEVILPDEAKLQLVKINDKSQPVRQEGRLLSLPVVELAETQPGTQTIYAEWYQSSDGLFRLRGPKVRIGDQAVNADVTFNMPMNRWILWTSGPRLGPAVLFWSYLFVVFLAALCLGKIPLTPLKTGHWILLGLGLTQVSPVVALLIVGWLIALGLRKKHAPDHWFWFDGMQLLLSGWTLSALISLYEAVRNGLLGIPNMQISGNGSGNFSLHWTMDRIVAFMPQPCTISLPLWVYHVLMLIWALWLAMSLLKWLRWGWQCFSDTTLWKALPIRKLRKNE